MRAAPVKLAQAAFSRLLRWLRLLLVVVLVSLLVRLLLRVVV